MSYSKAPNELNGKMATKLTVQLCEKCKKKN